MRIVATLPQVGAEASPEALARAAQRSEELGYDLRRVPLGAKQMLNAAHAAGMPHLDWWIGRWDDARRGDGIPLRRVRSA